MPSSLSGPLTVRPSACLCVSSVRLCARDEAQQQAWSVQVVVDDQRLFPVSARFFSHPDPFLVGYAGNWSPDGTLYDPPTCEAAVGTLY